MAGTGSVSRIRSASESPATENEVDSVRPKRLKRQARSGRQAGDQRLNGRRFVQVLGDLVGIAAGANPETVGRCALRQADRGQPSPFVSAQGGTKRVARLMAGMRARRRDGDAHPGEGSWATATLGASRSVPLTDDARRVAQPAKLFDHEL